jgi:glycosyltransferase involved in cell wall biosynthesis
MWWITGGCHHSRGCNNFKNECGNCHFLISPSANDCSHLHFKTKLGMISSSRPTVITPSHWLAKTVAESAIGKYVDLTVIPNGIDLQIYKPQTVNINLELDSQKRIILFIAANASSPYKGVHYLIDAINAMPDENLHLVVIGTVKDPKIFNRLKISYTLKGKISNKELLIAYYNRADVFMLPSLEENLPNTIIEAMACGTPALAFDTGGVSEIIDHCINGYVARYKDTADLTVGLKFILTADKSGLSAAAVSKIKSSFANDVVAQKLAELYLTKLAANV